MTDQQPSSSFLLLNSGPVENDQYRGDLDLFAAHGLSKVADVVLSGNSKIQNYAAGLKHFDGLRKGANMELAPLADLYPSSIKPYFAPIKNSNGNNITLEAGNFSLNEAELGVPVDSRALLGEEKPTAQPPAAATASAGALPKPTKIRLVVKK